MPKEKRDKIIRHPRENVQDNSIQCDFSVWQDLTKTNVNNASSLPGIYEIAIYKPNCIDEKKTTYLGMSCHLSERLKDHLLGKRFFMGDIRTSNIHPAIKISKKRNYKIAFRFFEMKTKKLAKEFESLLLLTFDYAWNIDENDKRIRHLFE